MKRFVSISLILSAFLAVSCLQDPVMPDSEPAAPAVGVDNGSLTRKAVTVTGSFTDRSSGIVEYGFQVAEGSPESWKVIAKNPPKNGSGQFSYTYEELVQGHVYYFRTYISNGSTAKYSAASDPVQALPNTVASVTEVSLEGCVLTARIADDGGRPIVSVGFLGGASSSLSELTQNGTDIPAVLDADGKHFSARVGNDFELGETYYFIAYVENAEDASHTYRGYSPSALSVTVDDAFPAKIADPVFAEYLAAHFDSNKDGLFSWAELRTIKAIDVTTDKIASIPEIVWMPELQRLSCRGTAQGSGKLASLDISQNSKLTALYCDNNAIEELALAANPLLDTLSCAFNQIRQLDLEEKGALRYLDVRGNPLTEIDLYPCASLRTFDARNCPSLQRILVWMNFNKARYPGFKSDASAEYAPSPMSAVPFADAAFEAFCISNFDGNKNGELSIAEAETVQEIVVSTEEIESLQGLEYFTGLQRLSCCGPETGGLLTTLDLSHNSLLQRLDCRRNQLSLLDVSANGLLSELDCSDNPLQRILLNPDQTVASLNKPDSTPLIYRITGLSLAEEALLLQRNEQRALTVTIDPDATVNEEHIRAGISWESSNERVATVTQEGVVTAVAAGSCTITAAYDGKTAACAVTVVIPVTEIVLDKTEMRISVGEARTIMVTIWPNNASDKTILWSSDDESVATVSDRGSVTGVGPGTCTITAQAGDICATCQVEVSGVLLTGGLFPDGVFRHYLSVQFDENKDNVLSQDEIASITRIDLPAGNITSVQTLSGIEFLGALQYLDCSGNQLTILDVSRNPMLEALYCGNNPELKEIWLNTGQTIAILEYDSDIAAICYY